MIVEWTYEAMALTILLLLLYLLFSFWAKSGVKIIGLTIGMIGLWLALVNPHYEKNLPKKTTNVPNIKDFLISENAAITDTISLVGWDHELEEIELLDSFFIQLPDTAEIKVGFQEVFFPSEVIEGEQFDISTNLFQKDGLIANVNLVEPDGQTVEMSRQESGRYEAKLTAPSEGLYVYNLQTVLEADTISEMIPIQVQKAQKLNMLVYASSPQFELNNLKNFWVDQGHGILQKVKVSRDRYNTSAINIEIKDFNDITSQLLDKVDIVLLDFITWNGLTGIERNRVLRSVSEKGLGLILKPTTAGSQANGLPANKVESFTTRELAGVDLDGIEYNAGGLWRNLEHGLSYKKGLGTIFLLRWDGTYKLLLANEELEYNGIWSSIFSEVFTKVSEDFSLSTDFPIYTGKETTVFVSGVEQMDKIYFDSITLPRLNIPYLWGASQITLTPRKGWNKLIRESDSTEAWIYASADSTWMTLQQLRLKKGIERNQSLSKTIISDTYQVKIDFPWWMGIGLVLIGFGMVWVLEKFG